MTRALVFAIVLGACSNATAPKLDSGTSKDTGGGGGDDAPNPDIDAPVIDAPRVIDGPPGAYRHTIVVDGNDDFSPGESFMTTSSPSFTAKVTWDDQYIFVGYTGPDLDPAAPESNTKWLFVYLDTDPSPNTATGATSSQTYNTQTAMFPTGFGAEYYARWRCDGMLASIEQYDGNGGWSSSTTMPVTGRVGNVLELAIPRSLFQASSHVGLVTWMINEKGGVEGSYAGLYANNFTDGYAMTLPITKYLLVDFASSMKPDSPANVKP